MICERYGILVTCHRHPTGPYGSLCAFGWVFTFYHHDGKLRFGVNRTA